MKSFKTFNLVLVSFVALFICMVASFSWVVDPYAIFKNDFFPVKPTITRNARLVKAHQVKDYNADIIILGSSRTEAGFDPSHASFNNLRTYNLGLPGANLAEQFAYLKHAHAAHPIKKLIFQPDFFSFNAFREKQSGFNVDILLDQESDVLAAAKIRFKKYALLLNIDSVIHAYQTIRYQNPNIIFGNLYFRNGFNDPEHRLRRVGMTGGSKASFEKGIARYFNEIWFPKGKDSFAFQHDGYYSFADYETILKFALDRDIETQIIIAPVHAWHLQALDIAGLWPLWVQWKERIVEINDNIAKFPLYDYSGYTRFTTEMVPDGKDVHMDWYLDNAHYRKELGDLILSGGASGAPLVRQRMRNYQRRENAMHRRYKTQNHEIIDRLQEIADENLPQD